jgi:hypothetical protein
MAHPTVTSLLEEKTADSGEFIEICGKSKILFTFEGVFNLSL